MGLWTKFGTTNTKKTGIPETVKLPAENTSLVDVFEQNFQKFGNRDAFIFMDKALSFQALDLASRQFAAYLQSLNLPKGSRVAVMMPQRAAISHCGGCRATRRVGVGQCQPTLHRA